MLRHPSEKSESVICSIVSNSLRPYGLQPARFLCPWNSLGKNTGVSCHALLQGSSGPRDLRHVSYVSCMGRQVLYHLCHLGSPSIDEWINKMQYIHMCVYGLPWWLRR